MTILCSSQHTQMNKKNVFFQCTENKYKAFLRGERSSATLIDQVLLTFRARLAPSFLSWNIKIWCTKCTLKAFSSAT